MGPIQLESTRTLNALIVDDERAARATLRKQLVNLENVAIVAEAINARGAIEQLRRFNVDVVFLDVNMPDATGLALAKALQTLQAPPAIVFASAHGEYALEAFNVHAVDFLVKPVVPERLQIAIDRVREHIELRSLYRKSERIPIDNGEKKVFIPVCDIRFARAQSDYAYVQTGVNRYFAVSSLGRLEESLGKYGFLRVHRSFLVNLDLVEEVKPDTGGRLMLTLNGVGDKIPVSRRRAQQVKSVLGM